MPENPPSSIPSQKSESSQKISYLQLLEPQYEKYGLTCMKKILITLSTKLSDLNSSSMIP
jgi:hypothetical protein